jgi:hypothetical protein
LASFNIGANGATATAARNAINIEGSANTGVNGGTAFRSAITNFQQNMRLNLQNEDVDGNALVVTIDEQGTSNMNALKAVATGVGTGNYHAILATDDLGATFGGSTDNSLVNVVSANANAIGLHINLSDNTAPVSTTFLTAQIGATELFRVNANAVRIKTGLNLGYLTGTNSPSAAQIRANNVIRIDNDLALPALDNDSMDIGRTVIILNAKNADAAVTGSTDRTTILNDQSAVFVWDGTTWR